MISIYLLLDMGLFFPPFSHYVTKWQKNSCYQNTLTIVVLISATA